MQKRIHSLIIGLLFVPYYISGYSGLSSQDVKILHSDHRSLVLEFQMSGFQTSTVQGTDGERYTIYSFDTQTFAGKTGEPIIPIRQLLIGIPLESFPHIEILETSYREKYNVKLAPMPEIFQENGIDREVFQIKADTYKSTRHHLLAELKDAGSLRDQRVARLVISPVQYSPEKGMVKIYSRIRVRIHFPTETKKISYGAIENDHDHIYRQAILNYDVSKNWIKPREKRLSKTANPLESGMWYKISVASDGIYKLDRSLLESYGVNLSEIDPKTIQIFNNGGKELPRSIHAERPQGLIENNIYVAGEEDGSFDEDDYILFYGKSVKGWRLDNKIGRFVHYIHHYTNENIYFLTFGKTNGKRMETIEIKSNDSNLAFQPQTFRERVFMEEEATNLFGSGLEWLGDRFQDGRVRNYNFSFPYADPSDSLYFRIRLKGANDQAPNSGDPQYKHEFEIRFNNILLTSGNFFKIESKIFLGGQENVVREGDNTLTIDYSSPNKDSEVYLDWFEIEYSRGFHADDGELFFESPRNQSGLIEYVIGGFSENDNITVLDVSDATNVKRLTVESLTDTSRRMIRDNLDEGEIKQYYTSSDTKLKTPVNIWEDENSDLRNIPGADFVIIAHEDFYDAAVRLADHRQATDTLISSAVAVKITDVFDEFSSGLYDASAVRDFLKYTFDSENWSSRPSYVLLFGDGDFDPRNIEGTNDKNWIPTYQIDSNNEIFARTTDDWFVQLQNDNLADMSIGRITTQTTAQAEAIVQKIIDYDTNPELGAWKNTIVLVADDERVSNGRQTREDEAHTIQTERLSTFVPNRFDVRKIYLVDYPIANGSSSAITRKPQASEDLLRQINDGALIVNYIGHGASNLWAHERLLEPEDMPNIQNENRLALWVAASCSFGKFDDPFTQSMSEKVLVTESRGAIAVFSATRASFSNLNAVMNNEFFKKLLTSSGVTNRLGDAVRLAKGNIDSNEEKYILFGDPTMRLTSPHKSVQITGIEPDTLMKALSRVTVFGHVENENNTIATEFNGVVFLKAFDSKRKFKYDYQWRDLFNRTGTNTIDFTSPGGLVFQGEASVQNGEFQVQFIVPKDINYGGDDGRVSAYIFSENTRQDGSGYFNGISIGGTSTDIVDNEGPVITIGFKGQMFSDGDYVPMNPVLLVDVFDENGINLTGETGHELRLIIDDDPLTQRDITSRFRYHVDSHQSGTVDFPLTNLDEGEHTLTLKVWDTSNNSSTENVTFRLYNNDQLNIRSALNYPNPFSTQTTFTFEVSQPAEITLKIYTVSGRLIQKLEISRDEINIGFNHIEWNGLDRDGDRLANGVYLYTISAQVDQLKSEAMNKLVIAQ